MSTTIETGTLIAGTTLTEDLLDAFLPLLEEVDPDLHDAVMQNGGQASTAWREGWLHAEPALYGADAQAWLAEEVWPAMEEIAPEGTEFGSHPGDASDYGFWAVKPEITYNRTRTEHGEPREGWFCEPCDEGGFSEDIQGRDHEVNEHLRDAHGDAG